MCKRNRIARGIGVLDRVRAQRVAHAPHQARGLHAVPGDIADDDDDAAVGRLERVVPVAADIDVHLGRPVRGRDLHAGERRQLIGNDRRLQELDDAVFGLEPLLALLPQPGALERGRAAPPEVDRELESAGPSRSRRSSPIESTASRRPATVSGTSTHDSKPTRSNFARRSGSAASAVPRPEQ